MKPSEVTSLPNFNKLVMMITHQAELKPVAWSIGHAWGINDVSLRKLNNHKKRVKENTSKLAAWAGRVRPEGETLYVSRYIYRRYKNELARTEDSIIKLSAYLDEAIY